MTEREPVLFITSERRIPMDAANKIRSQLSEQILEARVIVLDGGLKVKQMWSGDPEMIAEAFHESYERLAPEFGYRTREESAVDWQDVPIENKKLMIATVTDLLEEGVIS